MTEDASTGSTVTCPACHVEVPNGEFCGACGYHLATGAGRHHDYAARPGEHIFHLSVVSTLFPHLPRRRRAPFQIALLTGASLLVVLGLLRLIGPEIAAAALVVPLLYLVYLYEVEVYEDEPLEVIGLTFVLGILIGIPWALLTGPFVTQTLLQNVTVGMSLGRDIVAGILLPLVAQLLMLAGAIVLYLRGRYDEALDGFTFGVGCAMGFTLATTVVNLWPELREGVTSSVPIVDNAIEVLLRGILIPFINASTTGLIAGALWLQRGRKRNLPAYGWTASVPFAVAVVVVARIVLGWVSIAVLTVGVVVGVYALVAAVLLLMVRVAIHHMLLAEAVETPIGPPTVCANCHYVVPRMAFCPHCGVATRATTKAGPGRLRRAVR